MSRVRSLSLPSARIGIVLIAVLVAGALAVAASIDAPRSSTSGPSEGPGGVAGTTTNITSANRALSKAVGAPAGGTVEGELTAPGGGRSADVGSSTTGPTADLAEAATDEGGTSVTGSVLAPPAIDAQIVRTGTMELRVRRGHFDDAWRDASAVAGSFGGSVQAASRSGSGKDARIGTITLRIPSGRFDAAVARLRDVSSTTVRQLDIASQDVTQEYVDTKSRLRHDRAVEARLLALLARTKDVGEVLAVQARLDAVQEAIEVSSGRVQYLAGASSTSTIQVSLREPGAAGTPDHSAEHHPSVLRAAVDDAREQGTERIASAIVWVGGALPTLVLLLVVGIVARTAWTRRRRRDADPA
ncbi:MAG: hypothetical protein JWM98_2785 [Thermoleophilia bacterium]|nr:hypothetical protein [Thermoleophilia bacterium]